MGNNSSQSHEYEEGPQYRYHEAVLREARNTAPPLYLSDDDEQFYSAEEGDSSSSVTPERERPESSSGGEQNSDSDSNEVETTSPEVSHAAERRALTASERSYGRRNVSIGQDQDSINLELEAIAGENSAFGQAGSLLTCSKRPLSLSSPQQHVVHKRLKAGTKSSPFQPICSGNRQQRLIHRLSETISPGKRKIQSDGEEENALPTKRAFTEGPPKRVRLGYFDSSESDSSDNGRRGRSRRKRAKVSKIGNKRQLSDSGRSSCEKDDSEKFGNPSRASIEAEQKHSEEEGSEHGQGKTYQHEGKCSLDQNLQETNGDIQASNALLSSRARRLRNRLLSNIILREENHNTNHSCLNPPDNRHTEHADHSSVIQCSGHRTVIRRPDQASGGNVCADSDFEQMSETTVNRGKMGNFGIRNPQGKVLPLHQLRPPTLPSSSPPRPQSERNTTGSNPILPSANVSNISERLHLTSGAFVRLQTLPSYPTLLNSSPSNVEAQDSNAFTASQNLAKIKNGYLQSGNGSAANTSPSKCNSSPNKRSLSENPFQDFYLSPPSKQPHISLEEDARQGSSADNTVGKEDSMETDVPHLDEAYDSQISQSDLVTMNADRPILRAKRSLGNTVAERFRNFWNRKKIGPNIKSIFSKSKSSVLPSPKQYSPSSRNKAGGGFDHSSQDVSLFEVNDLCASAPGSFLSSANSVRPAHVLSPCVRNDSFTDQASLSSHAAPQNSPTLSQRGGTRQTRSQLGPSTGAKYRTEAFAKETSSQPERGTPTRLSGHQSTGTLVKQLAVKSQFQALSVQFGESVTVSVSLGDLADQTTEGLVNWTDGQLTHTVTECSTALAARAGALFTAGCQDYLENKDGPLEAPDVLITVAGGRFEPSVQAILHVVSPSPNGTPPSRRRNRQVKHRGMGEDEAAKSLLLQVYANCLRFSEGKLGLKSLALPLIGLGDFSMETCVQCFHDSLLLFLAENGFPSSLAPSISLSSVHLIIPDARTTDSVAELLQSCLGRISTPEAFSAAVSVISKKPSTISNTKRQSSSSTETVAAASLVTAESEVKHSEDQGKRTASGRPRVKRRRL